MIAKAKKSFHGKEGLNCAQAVLKAFQKEFNLSEAIIKDTRAAGGGRAEGGMCGALYAVKLITYNLDSTIFEDIKDDFEKEAGSIYCKQIRRLRKLTCRECVGLAAQKLEEYS